MWKMHPLLAVFVERIFRRYGKGIGALSDPVSLGPVRHRSLALHPDHGHSGPRPLPNGAPRGWHRATGPWGVSQGASGGADRSGTGWCAAYDLRDPRAAALLAGAAGRSAADLYDACAALLPIPAGLRPETVAILGQMLARPMAEVLAAEPLRD